MLVRAARVLDENLNIVPARPMQNPHGPGCLRPTKINAGNVSRRVPRQRVDGVREPIVADRSIVMPRVRLKNIQNAAL